MPRKGVSKEAKCQIPIYKMRQVVTYACNLPMWAFVFISDISIKRILHLFYQQRLRHTQDFLAVTNAR